ncbi:hypothetical protein RhiirC2_793979 [Rhizophagus irregularis]|uniref:Reverse transcriptase domain-containing protein n=1 Tax=Rhizophagus irregularis TaxID=588596 RepID=A0A2N1MED7_9GLOM|nr:hypothetical protein RhiirC2_793979 [Rhizophagus irregularis]
MGYEIEHCFKSNVQSDQEEKLRINVSSQSYMDDVTWITKSKAQLEQILKIADEFNIMNNIQTNYDKFEMITNKKLDKDIVEVNFRLSKRMIKPLTSKESVRILGVWINLDLKTNYVFNQCKDMGSVGLPDLLEWSFEGWTFRTVRPSERFLEDWTSGTFWNSSWKVEPPFWKDN